MTKREMATEILTSLFNITLEKANNLANKNHGEFEKLMKAKKSHLEEMYEIHLRVVKYKLTA